VTYLRFPSEHHKRIPTTNWLERLNGEGRGRTKVIARFPTERPCLSLLFATLITASSRWRGVPISVSLGRRWRERRRKPTPSRFFSGEIPLDLLIRMA
jgi:transposase-like protein